MNTIQTKHLIIREIEEKDFIKLYNICYSKFVIQYNPMKKKTLEQFLQEMRLSQDSIYVIENKEDQNVIGQIEFSQDHLRYRANSKILSYYLDKQYTKQGYMYEALNALLKEILNSDIDIISARCYKENIGSQKLLEKLGFIQEGLLRNAVKDHQNIIHDDYLYSLQKNELK